MTTATLAAQNRAIVVGALEGAMAGDVERFLGAMHAEVQVHEPLYLPYGGRYEGREGFLELFSQAAKFIDVTKIDIVSATADKDRCVLLMEIPFLKTGEKLHITEHWTVRDGLVTDVRVFWFELPVFD